MYFIEESASESGSEAEQPTWKGIAYLILGATLIFLFAEPFIHSVVAIAKEFKVYIIFFALVDPSRPIIQFLSNSSESVIWFLARSLRSSRTIYCYLYY